jgi:iron(III) transport system permease protein
MLIALLIRKLPYLVRAAYASSLQLDKALEEASEVEGAARFQTFWRISLPLL